MKYPNGDEAQSVVITYELKVIGGELYCDREETLELRYFTLEALPELFCKQHEEFAADLKEWKNG
jgi:hypothetical protein